MNRWKKSLLKGLVLMMSISTLAGGSAGAAQTEREAVSYCPFTETEEAWATEFPAATSLKLPSFFQSGMLFQQQKPIGVWGVDVPGTRVNVTLASPSLTRTGSALAGENGYWRVELEALEASYTAYTLTVSGSQKKTIDNLLIGELFISAGQSNMFFQVNNIIGGRALVDDNTRPNLRMMIMPVNPAENGAHLARPQFDYRNCRWYDGTSKSGIGQCSGVSYTYARKLYDTLNQNGAQVPVGMIDTAMGSLVAELYLSRQIVETVPQVKAAVQRIGYYKNVAAVTDDNYLQMSTFYNAKIAPLSGFNVRGFIWYQGEANNAYPEDYTVLLDALERTFSESFHAPSGEMLPFIFAQLAPHSTLLSQGNEYTPLGFDRWPRINEAMAAAWLLHPDTSAQVPIYDISTVSETAAYTAGKVDKSLQVVSPTTDHPIHPITKQQVGERMAQAALGLIYGAQAEWRAPVMHAVTAAEDGKLLVSFDYVGEGLRLISGSEVRGFEVCGANGIFVPARAQITGRDTVTVWSDFIASPVGVNYAFSAMNNNANLGNSENMPAVGFRHHEACERATYAYNKDWALCDSTEIWVDSGYFHSWGSIEGFTFKLTGGAVIPMTFRGSGNLPAWSVSPVNGSTDASVTVESSEKTEGSASLRLTYAAPAEGHVGFGPFLQHASQENSFAELRYMAFDLKNEDARDKTLTCVLETYDGRLYTIPFVDEHGENVDTSVLASSDGSFYTFVTDLRALKDADGVTVSNAAERVAVLNRICRLQITVSDSEAGSLLFDYFRFGPNNADVLPARGKTAQIKLEYTDQTVPLTVPTESPSASGWLWAAAGAAAVAAAGALLWLCSRRRNKRS